MVNEQANVKVTLNSQEAQRELENLQGEMKRLIALKKKAEEKGDVDGYKRIDKELKKVNREANKLVREHRDLDRIINNISGASINELRQAQRALTAQTNKLNRNTDEYVKKRAQLKLVKDEISNINASMRSQQTLWQKIKGLVLPVAGIAAFTAGIRQVVRRMGEAIEAADNFQERLDNLSALTGLEGRALDELGETAKQTSVKITEGGVRIKQSADDIVDAYTKVGSQRPELLKNGEALASVTEDAIILSEAAKSALEPAVAGLTTTMNQFNIGAEGSRRIINAMAAGSKEGAADIPYLTEAIEKSGTTMNLMNVSLEENIGLIEAIAPNYAKAQLAGNSLDKVFLKLKEKQIGYKDGVFSVNAALEELEHRYKNGETAASIFGVEHAKMGELLVQNKDEFNRYTKAVTDTNIAIEQAAKNTNNAKAIQAQARNEFKLAAIELGQNLSPAMVTLYKTAGSVASAFSRMIAASPVDQLMKEQREVNGLTVELTSANTAEDRRRQILEQLREINPKIVEGLSAENIQVGLLKDNLRLYNEELANRIVLQNLSEEEEEEAAKVAKQMQLVADYKVRINQLIAETDEDIALSNDSFEEKVRKTREILGKQQYRDIYGTWVNGAIELNTLTEQLGLSQQRLNEAQSGQTDLSERIQSMKEILGLTQDIKEEATGGTETSVTDGGSGETPDLFSAPDVQLTEDNTIYDADTLAHAEMLAAKKAGEEEWTEFLKKQIEDRENAIAQELFIEEQIEQARQDLKDMRIDAIGQIAGAISGMFEQGSAAYVAFFALEKAMALAQVWMSYAKESAAHHAVAATMGPAGIAYDAAMQAKALTTAGVNTGLIVAQTIAQIASGKGKKSGGFTDMNAREDEVTDFVHGKEWVASAPAVRNPAVRKFINIFDLAQRNGTIQNLNLTDIAQAASGTMGRQSGGYTSTSPVPSVSPPSQGGDSSALAGWGGSEALLDKIDKLGDRIEAMNISISVEKYERERDKWLKIQQTKGL